MSLMDQMRSEGIVPNVYCFSSLINACGKVRSDESRRPVVVAVLVHTYDRKHSFASLENWFL